MGEKGNKKPSSKFQINVVFLLFDLSTLEVKKKQVLLTVTACFANFAYFIVFFLPTQEPIFFWGGGKFELCFPFSSGRSIYIYSRPGV